jgi:uncharacterized membrane protein HdeD (DUF308 family)
MAKKEEKPKSSYRNMAERWKTMVAQGIIALVIGIVIVAQPSLSAKVVSIILGAFLIVFAILSFVGAHSAGQDDEPSTWLWIRGVLAAAGGLVILFWPGLKNLGLVYVVGVFAIVAGALLGGSGLMQKWDGIYKAIAAIGGLVSVAFGVIIISLRSSATGSIIWVTGLYAIFLGLWLLILGVGARSIEKPASK